MAKCRRCGGTGREPFPEAMGWAARRRRERAGLTQAEVSVKAKVSPQYLCDLEKGRRSWSGDGAVRVLNALDRLKS